MIQPSSETEAYGDGNGDADFEKNLGFDVDRDGLFLDHRSAATTAAGRDYVNAVLRARWCIDLVEQRRDGVQKRVHGNDKRRRESSGHRLPLIGEIAYMLLRIKGALCRWAVRPRPHPGHNWHACLRPNLWRSREADQKVAFGHEIKANPRVNRGRVFDTTACRRCGGDMCPRARNNDGCY